MSTTVLPNVDAGRTGYVRTAIEAGVPIVPVVSIGGQETQLVLTRGESLAKVMPWTKAFRTKPYRWPWAFPGASRWVSRRTSRC